MMTAHSKDSIKIIIEAVTTLFDTFKRLDMERQHIDV
jgi:hypothetical protein